MTRDDEVTDVLALLAAGDLAAFARLADDAAHAPELRARITLSRMASAGLAPLESLEAYAVAQGTDPEVFDDRIWQLREILADFDARTTPRDWWERLVRTYIGYGVAYELEYIVARDLDASSAAVAEPSLGDDGLGVYVVDVLAPVIQAEPQLGARLALWGRRVVGEALEVANRLLLASPALVRAAGVTPRGARVEVEDLAPLMGQLTSGHARRMARLGLTS